MPILRTLAVALTLVTRSALGADAPALLLPPPVLRAEPSAAPRSPVEERRPVELAVFGRALAPLDSAARGSGLGAGAGVSFRTSPYFSLGTEGSVLHVQAEDGDRTLSLELAAVGRVYLLEAGLLDPYLELVFGYGAERSRPGTAPSHGPSARVGGGLDLVVLSPLKLGLHVAYREIVRAAPGSAALDRGVRAEGGLLAGVALTLPLGEPL
jgi:hypothetical protein